MTSRSDVIRSCYRARLAGYGRVIRSFITVLLPLCSLVSGHVAAKSFEVHTPSELYRALDKFHSEQEPAQIVLHKGIYPVNRRLIVKAPDLLIRGATGNPDDVVLEGSGMKKRPGVEILIDVSASNVSISGLTLRQSANHLIQVRAENGVSNFRLSNCVLQDAYEQLLKVSGGPGTERKVSTNGKVENCVFEYTAGIGPQYYIGGIDAHRVHNWVIRNNTFRNIASPSEHIAEHAIHLWNYSRDNLVTGNLIVDSDRGIGFGMGDKPDQNSGGIISDNIIVHRNNRDPYADAAIILESSPNTLIRDNIIFMRHPYPNAIEYRFGRTQNVEITGNVLNRKITARNQSTGYVTDNHFESGDIKTSQ